LVCSWHNHPQLHTTLWTFLSDLEIQNPLLEATLAHATEAEKFIGKVCKHNYCANLFISMYQN